MPGLFQTNRITVQGQKGMGQSMAAGQSMTAGQASVWSELPWASRAQLGQNPNHCSGGTYDRPSGAFQRHDHLNL